MFLSKYYPCHLTHYPLRLCFLICTVDLVLLLIMSLHAEQLDEFPEFVPKSYDSSHYTNIIISTL